MDIGKTSFLERFNNLSISTFDDLSDFRVIEKKSNSLRISEFGIRNGRDNHPRKNESLL